MKIHWSWAGILIAWIPISIAAQNHSNAPVSAATTWAYDVLNLPKLSANKADPVTIAIVDAGFRLDHAAYKDFIKPSSSEVVNGLDDDGNGVVDDIIGWDVADNDPDVSYPKGREDFFSHGTKVAGTVAEVLNRVYGEEVKDIFRFLLVKARKDDATKKFIRSGYDGIHYAVKSGADIILCAWSGGEYNSTEHDPIFKEAQIKGISIIGAAGNFYSEKCDPPSSVNSVYAIAAIDSTLRKTEKSNYGQKIWMSAPGHLVLSAFPTAENAYTYFDETSAASAILAGCAAALFAANPDSEPTLVMEALQNTAVPINKNNPRIAGRLGSGIPNVSKAHQCLTEPEKRDGLFSSTISEGTIRIDRKTDSSKWQIRPFGPYIGVNLRVSGRWSKADSPTAVIYKGDSKAELDISGYNSKTFVACDSLDLQFNGKAKSKERRVHYESVPVDSINLYCQGTVYLSDDSGTISDGSGPNNYSNNVSCKWLITTEQSKHVRISFTEFDTQLDTDMVLVFNGQKPLQENLIAKFSGPTIPPVITTGSNQVLVWFLSSDSITGSGWKLNYSATDEPPGVKIQE